MAVTKIKPKLNFTILCDDVRQEMGGKFSLMGLFENIYSNAFPTMHPRFAIVNEWTGGKGEFHVRIRLLAPDQKQVISESDSTLNLFNENQRHRDISVRFNSTFSVPARTGSRHSSMKSAPASLLSPYRSYPTRMCIDTGP